MLSWVLLAGCGMTESEFRTTLDGHVRAMCETCGGQDCAAPPRDTHDDETADALCRFHPVAAQRCLDTVEAYTVDECTDTAGSPGAFTLPDDCAAAFDCGEAP